MMDARKAFRRQRVLCIICAGLAVLSVAIFVSPSRADGGIEPRRLYNTTPPVHIAEGQSLRVNFLNTGRSPFEIIPCIFDGEGAHIKTGETITLLPGQTRSFSITRAEAGQRTDPSALVRTGVHCDGSVRHCDGSVRKHLVVSGEVVDDATGRSTLFVPGLLRGFDPQPDPPAAN